MVLYRAEAQVLSGMKYKKSRHYFFLFEENRGNSVAPPCPLYTASPRSIGLIFLVPGPFRFNRVC